MTCRLSRRRLRLALLVAVGLTEFGVSPAGAATWARERTTPHLLDLVVIDRTGEPGWLFGPEDVAGDGVATFGAEERAVDLRTAYAAAPEDGRLWLRAYVSSESAPAPGLSVFFFVDRDDDRRTGGGAAAPEIEASFTRDGSRGGYDFVIGMQSGTAVASLWEWSADTDQYAPINEAPLASQVESGVDLDPLRLYADTHGYLQVALDGDELGIAPSCDAHLLVRSATTLGFADADVGELAPCIAADGDRNRVADIVEAPEALECEGDEQCPADGLCIARRCRYPSHCRADADCASDERCDENGVCRARGGASCAGGATCAGGLVCDNGASCQPCSGDASCASGERCAASGRCVDESTPSGAAAGASSNVAGAVVLQAGQEIQGGAGTCALRARGRGWHFAHGVLASLGLLAFVRRRRRRRWLWLVPPFVALGSADAGAQVDAQRLKPALTHDGWINAEGSAVRHPDDAWELGALVNYGYQPLIIANADESLAESLVGGRLGLDLLGSVSLSERFAIGVGLPVFLQHGDASPSTLGVGDVRVVPKLELVSDVEDGIGLSLAGELRAPTHGGDFSGGARSFTVFPKVILDHRSPSGLRIGANVGVLLREDQDFVNVTSGDEFAAAAALGYRFGGLAGKTEAGVELNGGVGLADADDEEVALEALGFLRHAFGPEWELKGGVGAGVLEGYGVPTWRVFIGMTFTPTSHDRDGDGIADSKDECVDYAEDRDGDEDADGCPEEDADADHDGVSDDDDRCPTTKETINGIDDDDGCPDDGERRVIFDDGEFVVLDTIRFSTGSSQVHPSAYPLLDQVALTLRASPEIRHMRIEGHTDDTGPREVNMRLSRERSEAVKQYLVRRGVSPKRLTLRSYGPDRPRETGTHDQARARNRRVEFIVE
jgi:OmpA-OmpF porin, OOP family